MEVFPLKEESPFIYTQQCSSCSSLKETGCPHGHHTRSCSLQFDLVSVHRTASKHLCIYVHVYGLTFASSYRLENRVILWIAKDLPCNLLYSSLTKKKGHITHWKQSPGPHQFISFCQSTSQFFVCFFCFACLFFHMICPYCMFVSLSGFSKDGVDRACYRFKTSVTLLGNYLFSLYYV